MPSLNEHMIIGHTGKEPELSYLPTGKAVCNLSVATTEKWKDKTTGESKEKTSWHRIVLWGPSAEFAGEYVHKGDTVMVKAPSYTREWTDKDGVKRYTTEINCTRYEHFTLLKGKSESRPGTRPAPAEGKKQEEFNDDIPF